MSAKNFEYTWNGKKVKLVAFGNLPAGVLRKTRNAKDPMDQAFLMIEQVADEKTIEIIDQMPVEDFGKMITEWAQGATPGESLRLLEIADKHPDAIRADFRSRFHISWDDAGDVYTWKEAIHLANILLKDPTSWLSTDIQGWKHPVSYEWMVLADVLDVLVAVNSRKGKAKRVPRPWQDKADGERIGKVKADQATVLRNLERMNKKE